MTGIAGVLNKNNSPIRELLKRMLDNIKHRGRLSKLILNHNRNSIIGCCINEMDDENVSKGSNNRVNLKSSNQNIWSKNNLQLVIDGHNPLLLNSYIKERYCLKDLEQSISLSQFNFSLGGFLDGKLILARDIFGIKPLYFCESDRYFAFCSEKKGLWEINLKNDVQTVLPGQLIIVDSGGVTKHNNRKIGSDNNEKYNPKEYVINIERLLTDAILSEVKNNESALLFSGGLDSSIIAKILLTNDVDPRLYCACFKNSRDYTRAFSAARILGSPLSFIELTDELVLENLTGIIKHLESTDTVTAEIATPFYFATQRARQDGFMKVFSGQGADEVFGGYSRYERIVHDMGYSGLQKAMAQDILNIWYKNLERDDKICMANGIELLIPYLTYPLVKYSLTIPAEVKVKRLSSGFIRKNILRMVGRRLKLPQELVKQPKCAVQYGSGTTKCYSRLSKRLINELDIDMDIVRALGFRSGNEFFMNYFGIITGLPQEEIKNSDGIKKYINYSNI